MDRWTIEQLKKIDDIDFAITILNERRRKVTPYSPLGVKLADAAHALCVIKCGYISVEKITSEEMRQLSAAM